MSIREERAVHTAPAVTSQELCHMARPSSAPFMATCPGENINYYLYGYLNLRERQEKTPRLGALSPEGLGATGGARGAAESLRKIRKAMRAPCDPCLPALTLFGSIILLLRTQAPSGGGEGTLKIQRPAQTHRVVLGGCFCQGRHFPNPEGKVPDTK